MRDAAHAYAAPLMQAHDRIDAALQQEEVFGEAAKSPVRQRDVAWLETVPQLPE